MSFTFFDELGVEPLAYVGQATDLEVIVPATIHYLYSSNKLNVIINYNCIRYIDTPKDDRFMNTPFKSRYLTVDGGDCQ